MTKNQLKKVAQIYSAVLLNNALGTGASAENMTLEEREYFADQVENISKRVGKGLPGEIFQISSLDSIVDYVLTGEINISHNLNQWD